MSRRHCPGPVHLPTIRELDDRLPELLLGSWLPSGRIAMQSIALALAIGGTVGYHLVTKPVPAGDRLVNSD